MAEVLRVAKESLRADLLQQLEQERLKRQSAEHAAETLEQRDAARRERLTARARRVAGTAARVMCVTLLILLTVGALLTFPWTLPQLQQAWYRYLTTAGLVAFFLYTVANIAWGSSVRSIGAWLEERLARHVERWLMRIAE